MPTAAQTKRTLVLTRKDLLRLREYRHKLPLAEPSLSWTSAVISFGFWTVLTTSFLICSATPRSVAVESYSVTVIPSQHIPASFEEVPQEEAESLDPLPEISIEDAVIFENKPISAGPEVQLELTPIVPPPNVVDPVVAQVPEISAIQLNSLQSNYWSEVYAAITKNLRYPMAARMQRVEGHVSVQISIDSEGHLLDAIERETSGRMFSSAVLAAAQRAAPYPPPPKQLPDPVVIEIPVSFRLDASSGPGHNFR